MPSCLSIRHKNDFRRFKLLVASICFPLFFFGQSLTGLWTGALSTDSNTIRKDQLFEIALTEYRGKVYGYSRSEFIVNDTLYYILKRVKGTIEGDICEVTDDEIIAFNFPGKLDKGVKVTSTFKRNKSDSTWYLAGTWKTNATKKYFSLTGTVDLEQEKDLSASKIFPHLEELKIADEVAFYKDRKEGVPIIKLARPERTKTEYHTHDLSLADPDKVVIDPSLVEKPTKTSEPAPLTAVEKVDLDLTTADIKPKTTNVKDPVAIKPGQPLMDKATHDKTIIPITTTEKTTDAFTTGVKATDPVKTVPTEAKKEPTALAKTSVPVKDSKTPVKTTTPNSNSIARNQPLPAPTVKVEDPVQKNKPVITPVNTPALPSVVERKALSIEEIIGKASNIGGRKSEFTQEVVFNSDSLELSLYDNGEIDGDTVSVYMNGELIMARQGLKASAIKKTIYLAKDNIEDFTLVLYAENLGKYPPNTGLLVVHDGEDVYNLRFSSDFQKSSGIVFRRKK